MKQEFTLKAVRQLKDEHDVLHTQVVADLKALTSDEYKEIPGYALHNLFDANSCYTNVLDRVIGNMQARQPCNQTDLELIDIRKTYYSRQLETLKRVRKPIVWQA